MHVYEELQSVGTCRGTNIYVSSQNAGSYIKVSAICFLYIHILVSICMYTKEVQSLSIRKGTNKCESAQHRSIY